MTAITFPFFKRKRAVSPSATRIQADIPRSESGDSFCYPLINFLQLIDCPFQEDLNLGSQR